MSRHIFRYVPFTIRQDPTAEPTYEAVCVSGEEKECGEKSDEWLTPHPVEVWMREHSKETGHRRYRRNFQDYAAVEAELPAGPWKHPYGDDSPSPPRRP
ncbi:hypothetical protein AB0B15_22110 [Streptomyces sp. NPDC045456]|uniref:DUF7848 domain-containing protein n=1 Tax=Streptomyces sp. NPDC045456 TaxID=3155254 RepID=UPI0033C8C344